MPGSVHSSDSDPDQRRDGWQWAVRDMRRRLGNTDLAHIDNTSSSDENDVHAPTMGPADIIRMHQNEDDQSGQSEEHSDVGSAFLDDVDGEAFPETAFMTQAVSSDDEGNEWYVAGGDREYFRRRSHRPRYNSQVQDDTMLTWDDFGGMTDDTAARVVDYIGQMAANQGVSEEEASGRVWRAYGVVLDYVLHRDHYEERDTPDWQLDLAAEVLEILEQNMTPGEVQHYRRSFIRRWRREPEQDPEWRWLERRS